MTGRGEIDWRGAEDGCVAFSRLLLGEEGRNRVVLVGLTAEHAHTLSSVWFLPNEHQAPRVKSPGRGGKRCLCKSPWSPFIHSQTAKLCCLVPSDWKLKSSPIPHPPPPLRFSLSCFFISVSAQKTSGEGPGHSNGGETAFSPPPHFPPASHPLCHHGEQSDWKRGADTPVNGHGDVTFRPLWSSSLKLSLSRSHHTETSSGVISPGRNSRS